MVALASCAPQASQAPQQVVRTSVAKDDSKHAVILRYDNDNIGVDGYNYLYVLKFLIILKLNIHFLFVELKLAMDRQKKSKDNL